MSTQVDARTKLITKLAQATRDQRLKWQRSDRAMADALVSGTQIFDEVLIGVPADSHLGLNVELRRASLRKPIGISAIGRAVQPHFWLVLSDTGEKTREVISSTDPDVEDALFDLYREALEALRIEDARRLGKYESLADKL